MSKKVSLYILTFLIYMSIDMMRTCYSFNKVNIQKQFGVNNLFLSLIDAWIFFTVGIGSFLKFFLSNSLKPIETCLWTCLVAALAFSIIPIIALSVPGKLGDVSMGLSYFILLFAMGAFGFFGFASFPVTLAVFCNSFSNKNDAKLVAIWSTRANVGHILGFFVPDLIVYSFGAPWEVTMFVCSGVLISSSILLYLFVQNPQSSRQNKITTAQFFTFIKSIWKQVDFRYYIFILSLFKTILYTYEFTTPKFLDTIGQGPLSGYVPSVFDGSTIIGSFIMGYLYKKQLNSTNKCIKIVAKTKLFVTSILIILICLLSANIRGSIGIYFGFGVLLGLFLGASYNFLQSSQVLRYSEGSIERCDMYASFTTGVSSTILGILLLVIGLILNVGKTQAQSQEVIKNGDIYYVIAGIGLLAIILLIARTIHQHKHNENRKSQQNNKKKAKEQSYNQFNTV